MALLERLLRPWRTPSTPTLAAIYLSADAGRPMYAVDAVEAIAHTGLRGDRYSQRAGFWQATDACEVTLISRDDLRRAARGRPATIRDKLEAGHHRRNLVIDGIATRALEGKAFRIGTAVFAWHKPRPPCGYLDRIEGEGLCKALGRNSGACLRVLEGGTLRVGDAIHILPDS
ncbi:MAG: MOSC domain-containing protein [Gammaproteobacteria bacterium]